MLDIITENESPIGSNSTEAHKNIISMADTLRSIGPEIQYTTRNRLRLIVSFSCVIIMATDCVRSQ